MEVRFDSLERRENSLTVVRGCLGTVLMHWDRLDDAMKKTLLETALEKTVALVRNLEEDLRPLRVNDLDVGAQPGSTTAAV